MATTIKFLRSDIAQTRPEPSILANGTPMVNLYESEPGLFFTARDGSLIKIGPAAIGPLPPNESPQGYPGNSLGELWLDSSGPSPVLKIYDGTDWTACIQGIGGAVTSVGVSFNEVFNIEGSPVTSSGTITATLKEQNAGSVFVGPASGLAAQPTFRSLVATDIPNIPGEKITSGVISPNVGGTGTTVIPTAGQLLIGTGTGWGVGSLSAGLNTEIIVGSGSLQVGISNNSTFDSVGLKDGGGDTLTLAASNVSTSYTLNFPSSDGSNGAVLTTNGSGQLSFETSIFGLSSIGGSNDLTISAGGMDGDVILTPTGAGVISVSTSRLTELSLPVNATDAASKAYVDSFISGVQPKEQVKAATTANIDLTVGGLLTIDTVTLLSGDRVLVKDQSLPKQNGIYEAASGAWVRTSDTNTFFELVGATTFVSGGAVGAGETFICSSSAGGTINVDPVNWVIFSSSLGSVTSVGLTMPSLFAVAGSPITSTGSFSVTLNAQAANQFLAGPTSGGSVAPTFRALSSADIPNDAVTDAKLATGSVTETKLATGSVTETKLATSSVTDAKLATGSVTETKLATGSVTDAKLATDSVTTAKLLDGSVTEAKLAPGVISSQVYPNRAAAIAAIPSLSTTISRLGWLDAGGLSYFIVKVAGATAIPDILGWVPDGEVYADHFGAVGDYNPSTDTGTNDLAAFNAAVNFLGSVSSNKLRGGRLYINKKHLINGRLALKLGVELFANQTVIGSANQPGGSAYPPVVSTGPAIVGSHLQGPVILIGTGDSGVVNIEVASTQIRKNADISSGGQNLNCGILIEPPDSAGAILLRNWVTNCLVKDQPADGIAIQGETGNTALSYNVSLNNARHGIACDWGDFGGRTNKGRPGIMNLTGNRQINSGGHHIAIGHPDNGASVPYRVSLYDCEGIRGGNNSTFLIQDAGCCIIGMDVTVVNTAMSGTSGTSGSVATLGHAFAIAGRSIAFISCRYIQYTQEPVLIFSQLGLSNKGFTFIGATPSTNSIPIPNNFIKATSSISDVNARAFNVSSASGFSQLPIDISSLPAGSNAIEFVYNNLLYSPTLESPILITPTLGTPISGNLANCNVPNSATTATNVNTFGAIVARDLSGNFSANSPVFNGLLVTQSAPVIRATSALSTDVPVRIPVFLTNPNSVAQEVFSKSIGELKNDLGVTPNTLTGSTNNTISGGNHTHAITPSLSWTGGTTSGPLINILNDSATIPSATSTASGVVTTVAQSFAGAKTFTNNVIATSLQATGATRPTTGIYGSGELNLSTNNTDRLIIAVNGQVYWPTIGTSSSAANLFVNNASSPVNQMLRSTSSLRYKTDVENIEQECADAVLNMRPVWFRSTSVNDRQDWSWYGLIAEEVAEIEPRLVHWTYLEDAYEEIEGKLQLKPEAELVPDGVQYDRLVVLLLDIVKRQEKRIKIIEAQSEQAP